MKVASWNVNSLRVRLEQVLEWLHRCQPDLLAVQETKLADDAFPVDEFAAQGYQVLFSGQRTYNGVAIISRHPGRDVITELDEFPDDQRRVLGATYGDVRLINLYVPNGQRVDSEKYSYKLEWLAALRAHLAKELARHPRVLVAGDFNIAPEARDVHDPAAWEGSVLVSDRERAALASILDEGFVDTFRLFEQPEKSFSWWDYRALAFRRNRGLRIDLILASRALGEYCTEASIDREPRRNERPSDHTPVLACFS